jgi:hypothetical protein
MKWYKFNDGKTIGTKGSEGGVIVKDYEHSDGARVTIEKGGDIAPYSVTVGIYGLMFHTAFSSSLDEAENQVEILKQKIEAVFSLLDVRDSERDNTWDDQYEARMNEIVAV